MPPSANFNADLDNSNTDYNEFCSRCLIVSLSLPSGRVAISSPTAFSSVQYALSGTESRNGLMGDGPGAVVRRALPRSSLVVPTAVHSNHRCTYIDSNNYRCQDGFDGQTWHQREGANKICAYARLSLACDTKLGVRPAVVSKNKLTTFYC